MRFVKKVKSVEKTKTLHFIHVCLKSFTLTENVLFSVFSLQKCSDVFDHVVQISADRYVPVEGDDLLPTGSFF